MSAVQGAAGGEGPVVVRPSASAYWQGLKLRAGVLVAALLVMGAVSAFSRSLGPVLWFGSLVVVALVTVSLVVVHLRTTAVRLEPGRLIRTGALVRDVTLPLNPSTRGLLARYVQPMTAPSDLLVLRAEPGGPRLRLWGGIWTHDELLQVARYAGAEVSEEASTAADVERAVPGSMPWRDRHPFRFAFLATGAILVVVVVAVVGGFRLTGRPPLDRQPPQAVSAATLAAQNALVTDVQGLEPGSWGGFQERYYSCQDATKHQGWTRWLKAVRETGPAWSTEQTTALTALLATRGFDRPRADAQSAGTYIHGYSSGADPTSIEVFTHPDGYVSVDVHSPCEVTSS